MRSPVRVFLMAAWGFLASSSQLLALDPSLIATSNPLSPEEELKAFTVPAGFEVQLVASEAEIEKPIQMAFDAKGRLWVTTSQNYRTGSDKLYILSQFDGNGKAQKVEVFANDLNIPMGIVPLPDCKSCIVSSAGQIRKYTDGFNWGPVEKMEVLYSRFGVDLDHELCHSFTFMPDGWIYACQGGVNKPNEVSNKEIYGEITEGCTFRFRPDGSRMEWYTRGHNHPFGIAVDPSFNLYVADCFSRPIAQLMPRAYYDGAGKAHDGLGYAPRLAQRSHKSKVLSGLAWYDGDHFPKEYRGTMFLGDPAANRIHCDRIDWKGATPACVEQPDFLVSKDPWFRPMDIKLGPDGALYICDFYNRLVGLTESDLKHPGWDKSRGRIWRIVWKGDGKASPRLSILESLINTSTGNLCNQYETANLTSKLLIMQELIRRYKLIPKEVVFDFERRSKGFDNKNDFPLLAWAFNSTIPSNQTFIYDTDFAFLRSNVNDAQGKAPISQNNLIHLIRAANTYHGYFHAIQKQTASLLSSSDPRIKFAAVQAIGSHPQTGLMRPLLELVRNCPSEDTHLRHAAKMALRDCLQDDEEAWQPFLKAKERSKENVPIYYEIALGLPLIHVSKFLVTQLAGKELPQQYIPAAAEHIARNGTEYDRTQCMMWLTALEFTPAIGDGLISYLKVFKDRKISLEERQRKWLMETLSVELNRLPPSEKPFPNDDVMRLISVCKVVAALPEFDLYTRDPETIKPLERLATTKSLKPELRFNAATALSRVEPKQGGPLVRKLVGDSSIPPLIKRRELLEMAASFNNEDQLDSRDAMRDAPYKLAVEIAAILAKSPLGMLDAVKTGKAPARLLQEKVILDQLRAAKIPDLDKQIAALTRGLQPLDKQIEELIEQRASNYPSAKTDTGLGAKVFAKHCAICHSIGGKGGKAGPGLDNVAFRGLDRLLEDILDPSRNVNQAYRTRIITTKDGRTITGLMLRVENGSLIVADGQGKQVALPIKDIDKNQGTMLSLMPTNFGELIPEKELFDLMAYLLDQNGNDPGMR